MATRLPGETDEEFAARQQQEALLATSSNISQDPSTRPWSGQKNRAHAASVTDWAQDPIRPDMNKLAARAKRERDFQLGASNNPEVAAMIGQAQSTGNRYAGQFGTQAATAGARSDAAQNRGTAGYMGDTSAYKQAIGNTQASRGMQVDAFGALQQFANQGPGPSAAQAQLQEATDANTRNALAMARSGRGMGGGAAAMRQAIGQNAATQQQANSQMAQLRANENTAYQQQRLQALGQAGTLASQTAQTDQGAADAALKGAQYTSDVALKGQQLNDAAAQAWAAQQLQGTNAGLGAEVGAQNQVFNLNEAAQAARVQEYNAAAAQAGQAQVQANAQQARQDSFVNAGIQGAGTVLSTAFGAASDERSKQDITPLGQFKDSSIVPSVTPLNGSPASGNSTKPNDYTPAPAPSVMKAASPAADPDAKAKSIGSTAGKAVGAAAGSAIGGPIGGMIGSAVGGLAGKQLGKVFSDVRAKTDIVPLGNGEAVPVEARTAFKKRFGWDPGARLENPAPGARRDWGADTGGKYGSISDAATRFGKIERPKKGDTDAYDALRALGAKYGARGVENSSANARDYSQDMSRDYSRFGWKDSDWGYDAPRESRAPDASDQISRAPSKAVRAQVDTAIAKRLAGDSETEKPAGEVTKLKPEQEAGFRQWIKKNNIRDLDHPDSHYDYRGAYLAGLARGPGSDGHFPDTFKQHGHPTFSTESQYSKGPKDGGDWIGETYLPEASQDPKSRVARRLARGNGPILSEGDALLADSARNAPGAAYTYKDPGSPGAAPGMHTGPMAQDLATHPLTAGMVSTDPNTGRLAVDGSRAALTGLAQNHSQQNQLDKIAAELDTLKNLLPDKLKKKKPGKTDFAPSSSFGGL